MSPDLMTARITDCQITDRLGLYLDSATADPRPFGPLPCLLFCADWVRAETGVDVAGEWRGYAVNRGRSMYVVDLEGGVEALARKAMDRHGFIFTAAPQIGDVGLIGGYDKDGGEPILAGAICTAPGLWAALTPRGILEAYIAPVLAWSLQLPAQCLVESTACRI